MCDRLRNAVESLVRQNKMRIKILYRSSQESSPESHYFPLESQNEGVFWIEEPQGIVRALLVPQPRFVLLHDLGVAAFLDGYHREAVITLAASIERFYEFYIHVASSHLGIDPGPLAETWEKTAKQSERQLGAFLFLYLAVTKQVCDLPIPMLARLRNKVVHNGYFPTQAETISYSFQVTWWISKLYTDALTVFKNEIVLYQMSLQNLSRLPAPPISIHSLPVGRPLNHFMSLSDFGEADFATECSKFHAHLNAIYVP